MASQRQTVLQVALLPGHHRDRASACCWAISTPRPATAMKPLGDGFIKLIKMIIAPIIFCTVVVGIAGMEDMKKVGKTGGLALLYFEVVSTIALVVGLVIVNVVQPGAGMNIDPSTLDTKAHRRLHPARARCRAPPSSCSTSSRTPWSTPSPRARSCRCCCSRCCSASRCTSFGGRGTLVFDFIEKFVARAVRDRRLHHEGRARSARSARWPSPSASTASARCCRSAS